MDETLKRSFVCAALTGIVLVASGGRAAAQGAIVHGSVAASTSENTTGVSVGGGVSYRFNRALGLGVELIHVSSLPPRFPYLSCCGASNDGRATLFTTNVRLEIPTVSTRVVPFVVGGGGVAGVTRSFDVYYALLAGQIASLGGQLPVGLVPGPRQLESTSTSMVLTLGGGASVMMTGHVSLDADIRLLHLMEADGGRNIGRFGGGVSYRF